MAIDKGLMTPAEELPLIPGSYIDENVSIPDGPSGDNVSIEDTDNGGVLINFDPEAPIEPELPFEVNLAEYIDGTDLTGLSSSLIDKYTRDKASRSDWEKTYKDGIDLLGLSIEDRTMPWDGASGVTHPILSEAVIRFQSQAIGEIFPEGGPVRTKLIGEGTVQKTAQGLRVENHMNWLIQEDMVEYREEMDRLLFALPAAGSAFKKIYHDPETEKIVATFIPAEDFVVSFGATSLKTANRATEIIRKPGNWVKKRQYAGFYRDVDLSAVDIERSDLKEKLSSTVGEVADATDDDLYTLIEMHVDLDLVGFEDGGEEFPTGIALPYVVTIDLGSNEVLSIYRNWLPDDEKRQKRQHYTHYQYIPGFGFYGLGLIHLLGGIAKGSTSMLRQLIDAGSLANLRAGFKTRGLNVRGENTPLAPGEYRDVDVPSGKIADNIMTLPVAEPSQTLFALLGSLVEEGRRFASLTDINISNMSQDAPVGTTLALIERNMKVMTAIQSRLHKSLKDEFQIIITILQGIPNKVYPYEVDVDPSSMEEDFDGRIDVIPVSDPNSSTSSHRIMKAQSALQMYALAPQEFNAKPLFRYAMEVMEIPGAKEIVPVSDDIIPMDPISENMSALTQSPIKAFIEQDHASHIQVHMLGMQDPKIQSILESSPQAQASAAAMMAHVTEHVAFQYRSEMENSMGVQLPPAGEQLPPEVEAEYSRLVAQAAAKLFERNTAEKQMIENEEQLQDPLTQIRMEELDMERMEKEANIYIKQQRLEIDKARLAQKDSSEEADRIQQAISSSERVQGELIGNIVRAASETEQLSSNERIKLFETLVRNIKDEAASIRVTRESNPER